MSLMTNTSKSFNITFNASSVFTPDNNTFVFRFPSGFYIPPNSTISLQQATIPYSFRNVIANLYGANTITYTMINSVGTTIFYPVYLPDGFYTINDINNVIQSQMYANGHYWYNTTSPLISQSIVYPISIGYNSILYTTQISTYTLPTPANIVSTFGANFVASGTWTGGYNTGGNTCAQLVLPTAKITTTNISNILGFVGGTYPTASITANPIKTLINGDSLISNPTAPFPAQGSFINAIIVRCNLCTNEANPPPNDILTTIPINATYGSNVNYINPNQGNYVKCVSGTYNRILVQLFDQNLNRLDMQDPNVSITLNIKFP